MRLLIFCCSWFVFRTSSSLLISQFLSFFVDLGVLQMLINDLFFFVVLLMCRFFYPCCLYCFCVKQIALIHRGSWINLSTSILSLKIDLKFLSYLINIFTCYRNWFDNHIDKVNRNQSIYHNIKTSFSLNSILKLFFPSSTIEEK